jgi:hypothetical protein
MSIDLSDPSSIGLKVTDLSRQLSAISFFVSLYSRMSSKLTHILHHSQQNQKNRVSKRKIKASRLYDWPETQFLMLVQDIS